LVAQSGLGQSFKWAQRIGNSKSDKITSIKTDGIGNVYIAGYFSNSISIGSNSLLLNNVANASSKEAFIAKLDSSGLCLWARAGGAYFDDRVLGMDVDSAGNCVITGTYWEGAGINFGAVTVTGSGFGSGDQCFIVKLNPNGVAVWGQFVCGNGYGDDQGFDVAFDKAGNIFAVGFLSADTLFCGGRSVMAVNPNKTSHKQCYWASKLDGNGNFLWARTFGNLPWDAAASKYVERDIALCVDEQNAVYIAGGFDGKRAFGLDTFTSIAGSHDVFVTKYDPAGNFVWANQVASNKDDWNNGICSDKNGHIYITGEHRDSLYMDSVLVKNYDKRDLYIFKVDAQTGKPLWGKRAGSNAGDERGNDVWADDKCNVYVCGDINEGASFGDDITTPVNGLGVQGFVARISPEGKWRWVVTGGGPGDEDRIAAIAKGKSHQLFVAGFFRSSATYGPHYLSSAGSSDGFMTQVYDSMLDKGIPFELIPPAKAVLCFGDTAVLNIPQHAWLQVTPTTGVSFNADSTRLVFQPNVTTSYSIYGLGEGDCAIYDTIIFTLQVGLDIFQFESPTDTSFCEGGSVLVDIPAHDYLSITPYKNILWSADSQRVEIRPAQTTTYRLAGGLSGVCPSTDTLNFTLVVHDNPDAAFQVSPQTVFIDKPDFTLNNQSWGADRYEWYDAEGNLISTDFSPRLSSTAIGNFCYHLVALTNAGCVDSATDCVTVIKREKVFFPSAFSPNGDGRNDWFHAVLTDIDLSKMRNFSFAVYNRFGTLVFKSNNPNDRWDGTMGGVKCDMGTYYYFCTFITPQGKEYNVKGDVALVQ